VWPACGYTRATNTAIRELRDKHGVKPDDVESITVIGGTGATQLLSEPLEKKRRPGLAIDGKFSIPFTTAVMMVKGNVTLRDYTDEGLRDPAVLAMADKVGYRIDPDAELPVGGYSSLSRPTVEIRTRDGRLHSCRPDGVPGDPDHPVSDELLEAKFRDCVSFSACRVPSPNVDRAIALIRDLENISDVTEVIRLLTPAAPTRES
jgi:2-methylcitrate dehydratase PrpD